MSHDKIKSDNDTSTARSAKAQKADEVREAGTARASGVHGDALVPEGGPAPAPIRHKGAPMPAASAAGSAAGEEGSSSATAGKAEKQAAAEHAAATKKQDGRGHRKSD